MKTGYVVTPEQKGRMEDLADEVESLIGTEDPRVVIAALSHVLAGAAVQLSRVPSEQLRTQIAQFLLVSSCKIATQINPFSRDY